MHIKDAEKLKAWLLQRLHPLCDADPAALSKYIVALLRKEKPRAALKDLCINQLEVFLSKETPSFVDRLFLTLDTESYLTGTSTDLSNATPTSQTKTTPINTTSGDMLPKTGHVISLSGGNADRIIIDHRRPSEDTRHREVDDDDRDFRRARYRHESSPVLNTAGDRGRKRKNEVDPPRRSLRPRLGQREDERNIRRRRVRSHSQSRSRSSTPERHVSSPQSNPDIQDNERTERKLLPGMKRQRCKDYDERGMCLLGEQCPYDHGIDPLVITGPIPPYPPPPFPMSIPPPPNLPKTTSGLLLPPLIPPRNTANTGVDGYNPEDPSLNASSKISHAGPPPLPTCMLPQIPLRPTFPPPLGIPGLGPPPLPPPPMPPLAMPLSHSMTRPGNFNTVVSAVPPTTTPFVRPHVNMSGVKNPYRPSNTVLLRKIPRDLNSITKLSSHFEKFGTIVNLQVRYENDPESAIVQFSSPQEAKAAHDSVEAVLNNRFIRVYYLKNTGSGGVANIWGQNDRQIKTSTPGEIAITSIRPDVLKENEDNQSLQATPTPETTPPTSHQLINKRSIPSSRPKQTLKQEKSIVMAATMKKMELQKKSQSLLEAQIQQQKLLLSKLEKSGKLLTSEEKSKVIETLKSLSSNIAKLKESVTKTVSAKPHPQRIRRISSSSESNQSLQQTADQLRIEAQQLGILPSGKMADLRTKLEAKPRQLLVMNVDDRDMLVKYFESFGGLNQVEVDPDNSKNLIFTFKNTAIAEKAVKGSIFKGKPLIMKWYTSKESKPSQTPPTKSNPVITRDNLHSTEQIIDKTEVGVVSKKEQLSLPLTNELDPEGLLDITKEDLETLPSIEVITPNQSKPRVVHLLDDDEEEEEDGRSWRR